jgi:hypothetical protein
MKSLPVVLVRRNINQVQCSSPSLQSSLVHLYHHPYLGVSNSFQPSPLSKLHQKRRALRSMDISHRAKMLSSPTKPTWKYRALQAIFSSATLGLVATLVADQFPNSTAALQYGLAAGVLSVLSAIVGLLSLWHPLLQGTPLLIIDAIALSSNLAGGLVRPHSILFSPILLLTVTQLFAIKLKGVDCLSQAMEPLRLTYLSIDIIAGDCQADARIYKCDAYDGTDGFLQRRCRWATAASVMMFLTFVVGLAGRSMQYFRSKGMW